jgi:tetratricopeptide (TPR) repeat protein
MIVLVAALLLGAPLAARAASPAPTPDPEAQRLYEEGLRLYRIGNYDEAIASLKASYLRTPAPGLLYDLAQAYRLKGDCGEALRLYREFLAAEHENGPARERAESRIAEMDRCQAAAPPVPAAAPSPASRAPPPAPIKAVAPAPVAPSLVAHPPSLARRRAALGLTGAAVVLASLTGFFAWQTVKASNDVSNSFQPGMQWNSGTAGAQSWGRTSEKLEIASAAGALLAGGVAAWLRFRR